MMRIYDIYLIHNEVSLSNMVICKNIRSQAQILKLRHYSTYSITMCCTDIDMLLVVYIRIGRTRFSHTIKDLFV